MILDDGRVRRAPPSPHGAGMRLLTGGVTADTAHPLLAGLLTAATILTGLIAGLLFGFACAVMPGLLRTDDRTFVVVMQSINRAIVNGWFLVCFLGAPVVLIAAGVARLVGGGGPWWPIAAAIGLSVLSYAITGTVNLPLNNALDAAGDPSGSSDPATARGAFERRWVRWNSARALASAAAFGCCAVALLVSV